MPPYRIADGRRFSHQRESFTYRAIQHGRTRTLHEDVTSPIARKGQGEELPCYAVFLCIALRSASTIGGVISAAATASSGPAPPAVAPIAVSTAVLSMPQIM